MKLLVNKLPLLPNQTKQSQVPRLTEKKILFTPTELKIIDICDLISVSGRNWLKFYNAQLFSKKLLDQIQFILIFKAFSLIFDENPGFQKSILLRLYIGNVSWDYYENIEL